MDRIDALKRVKECILASEGFDMGDYAFGRACGTPRCLVGWVEYVVNPEVKSPAVWRAESERRSEPVYAALLAVAPHEPPSPSTTLEAKAEDVAWEIHDQIYDGPSDVCDLSTPEGQAITLKIIEWIDAAIENLETEKEKGVPEPQLDHA